MIRLKDLVKIPNLVSLLRVFLMPFFMICFYKEQFLCTLILIIAIIITDFLDGFLSRALNQITEMGKVLDPLADKICLGLGLFAILLKAQITLIPLYVLISRDLLIVAAGGFLAKKNMAIPPSNLYGKLSTFFLSLTGLVFFINPFYQNVKWVYYGGVALYIIASVFIALSSISYFIRGVKIFKNFNTP